MGSYSLEHTPWLFTPRKGHAVEDTVYEKLFPLATRRLLHLVRQHSTLHPDAIVAPEIGMMTAGELALLWIHKQNQVRAERLARPKRIERLSKKAQGQHKEWLRKKDTHNKRVLRAAQRFQRQTPESAVLITVVKQELVA